MKKFLTVLLAMAIGVATFLRLRRRPPAPSSTPPPPSGS